MIGKKRKALGRDGRILLLLLLLLQLSFHSVAVVHTLVQTKQK
jgi:hypothetical protein